MGRLFAIRNNDSGEIAKKSMTLFGIKISYKNTWKTLKNLANTIRGRTEYLNDNMLNLVFMLSAKDTDLLYVKTDVSLIIFVKRALKTDSDFVRDFLFRHGGGRPLSFGMLSSKSDLYERHRKFFTNGKIICKYADKGGVVAKTVISQDQQGNLWYEQESLGAEICAADNVFVYNHSKRKVMDGVAVGDIVAAMSEDDKKRFLRDFFDWMFAKYQSKQDKDRVSPKMFDCYLFNFIYNSEGFHLIDEEVELHEDVEKNWCLWYANLITGLYEYFADCYGYENKACEYEKEWHSFCSRLEVLNKKWRSLNKKLFDLYFSERIFLPKNSPTFSQSSCNGTLRGL